jgi:hypothetical protein
MSPRERWKRTLTPYEVIDEAIEREDWFSAFSNAVSYFEFWNFWAIEAYCLRVNIDVEKKLRRLPASTLVLMLYLLKLIDFDTFSKMNIVIRERNKLVHTNLPEKIPIYDDDKKRAIAIQQLNDAKECIRIVRKTIRTDPSTEK